jgi:hypothetical protein
MVHRSTHQWVALVDTRMTHCRRKEFRYSLPRRLCTGLVLGAYLATALGFPLSISPRKESSQPFPCQDHPCGCRTAEACWRQCCCFSPAQRFAWARAHDVEPPSYAEQPGEMGWQTVRLRDQENGQGERRGRADCCPGHEADPLAASARACCSAESSRKSCCASQPAPGSGSKKGTVKARFRWNCMISAMKCQGMGTLWVASQAITPPLPRLRWTPNLACVGWTIHHQDNPVVTSYQPPDPPPRRSTI